MGFASHNDCAQGGVFADLVEFAAELVQREPIFGESLDAMRRDKLVFHLRLEASRLKFDVLAIIIRQLIHPNLPRFVRSPRPGFLPRQFVAVGNMDNSPIGFFVIHAEKIPL